MQIYDDTPENEKIVALPSAHTGTGNKHLVGSITLVVFYSLETCVCLRKCARGWSMLQKIFSTPYGIVAGGVVYGLVLLCHGHFIYHFPVSYSSGCCNSKPFQLRTTPFVSFLT
jgi:hypothetical protein